MPAARTEVPKIDVQVSGNLALMSGLPLCAANSGGPAAGAAQCQLRRAGLVSSARTKQWLFLRVSKMLLRSGPRRLELGVELRNTLQETSDGSLASRVVFQPELRPADHVADPATTPVSGEGVLLTVMKRWPWLRTAITVAACLTPAAAQGQGDRGAHPQPDRRPDVVRPFLRDAPEGNISGTGSVITPSVSGSTGGCWVTHWAISWTTTPS